MHICNILTLILSISILFYSILFYPSTGTSVCWSPSGHFLWAGFSDGTIRVFDVHGGFGLQQDYHAPSRQKQSMLVASKWCQKYGAVACQIHARGVHTDLLMDVQIAGNMVFGGVQRGAMELYAVHMGDLEQAANNFNLNVNVNVNGDKHQDKDKHKNILDYLQVSCHADAKLKGFGACVELQNNNHNNNNNHNHRRPSFLLLTGKGIKNIHIWKFQPKHQELPAVWEQIYDTQTNGNTIQLLSFYRSPTHLWAISKSGTQKLRLWDMTQEEEQEQEQDTLNTLNTDRPKRPSYQDVANSQAALGIAGHFCVCGGPTMYNQLSIVSLDQPRNAFNHTELALPGAADASPSGGRRQRRGDLKQVVRVATLDTNHALLELDDGSMVHYHSKTATDDDHCAQPQLTLVQQSQIPSLPAEYWRRTLSLARTGQGSVVAAVSMYNPNTQQGTMMVRTLVNDHNYVSSHKHNRRTVSSPDAADGLALQQVMQAPQPTPHDKPSQKAAKLPPLLFSLDKKPKKKKKKTLLLAAASSSSSSSSVLSPQAAVETNNHHHHHHQMPTTTSAVVPMSVDKNRGMLNLSVEKSKLASSMDNHSSTPTLAMTTPTTAMIKKKAAPKATSTLTNQKTKQQEKRMRIPGDDDAASLAQVSPEQRHGGGGTTPKEHSPDDSEKSTPMPEITKFFASSKRVLHQWNDQEYQQQQQQAAAMVVPRKPTSTNTHETIATAIQNKSHKAKVPPAAASGSNSSTQSKVSPSSVPKKKNKKKKEISPNAEMTAAPNNISKETKKASHEGMLLVKQEKKLRKKMLKLKRVEALAKAIDKENAVVESTKPKITSTASSAREPLANKNAIKSIQVNSSKVDTTPKSSGKKRSRDLATTIVSDKKQRLSSNESAPSEADIASILVDLKSPNGKKDTAAAVPLTREEIMAKKISGEYQKLLTLLNSLPNINSSSVLFRKQQASPTNRRDDVKSALEQQRTQLEEKHRAAHRMIQKRLLRAAETTLRMLMDSCISLDVARAELKESMGAYQEVVVRTHLLDCYTYVVLSGIQTNPPLTTLFVFYLFLL